MLAVYDDLVIAGQFGMGEQYMLDLCGKDIDAAHNQHIVCTPAYALHSHKSSAAFTWLIVESNTVARAVAQQRQRFACQAGEDEFAEFTLRDGFAGIGVDHFGIEMVFVDMQSIVKWTFEGHAGPITSVKP